MENCLPKPLALACLNHQINFKYCRSCMKTFKKFFTDAWSHRINFKYCKSCMETFKKLSKLHEAAELTVNDATAACC